MEVLEEVGVAGVEVGVEMGGVGVGVEVWRGGRTLLEGERGG